MGYLRWLIIVFLLAGCSKTEAIPRLPADGVILAFGDSITYGTGAGPTESYPAILEQLTGKKVVNGGVPGETTAEGLQRLPQLLEQVKPALVIICEGGNDMLRHLPLDEAAANLRAMVRRVQEKQGAAVLVSVPAPDLSFSPPPFYRQIGKEIGIPVDDRTLTKILGRRSLKSDFIHPNAAGYRLLAEGLAKLLQKSGAL